MRLTIWFGFHCTLLININLLCSLQGKADAWAKGLNLPQAPSYDFALQD